MPGRPPKPTMRDVSRLAGVSTMTVSRVLAEPGRVAPETGDRVRQAIEQLGYVPDRVAGSLSSRRTGFIAALLPTLTNANFADTALGLTEALRRADYQLIVGYTLYGLAEEERLIRTMLARRPEAIVLAGTSHTRAASRLLMAAGIPVVEIWEAPARPIEHAVGFSNREVGRAAARHLLALGHRRFGAIGPLPETDTRDLRGEERLTGFVSVLEEHGLGGALVVRQERAPLSFEHGARALAGILDGAPDTEAVFAVSDLGAVGALMECQRRGVRVPQDLSLMGFGDFEIGRQVVPALTTVRVDARGIGRRTGELILTLLGLPGSDAPAGGLMAETRLIDMGFELVERGSTAPAARRGGIPATSTEEAAS